jgi:hypothetical protein
VYVVQRGPTPGGPGPGLRPGHGRFLCQLPLGFYIYRWAHIYRKTVSWSDALIQLLYDMLLVRNEQLGDFDGGDLYLVQVGTAPCVISYASRKTFSGASQFTYREKASQEPSVKATRSMNRIEDHLR